MDNIKLVEQLFKAIFGELISDKYAEMSTQEVADVAEMTVNHFKQYSGLYTK